VTLRLRLLLVLVGIVAAGLVVADVATYNSLGSFLTARVDQQLVAAQDAVPNALTRCEGQPGFILPGGGPFANCNQFVRSVPPGTFGELRDQTGAVVGQPAFFLASGGNPPTLPSDLPGSGTDVNDSSSRYFSTSSPGPDSVHYQVLAAPVAGGGTLVVAIPVTDVDQTLGRLLWIEGLVTAAVLLALGLVAWWIVRRGLRPLDDMASTADAIAAGDLTQRVTDSGDRSEVGRLGLALNTMLGNIEQAFTARAASEDRLRRFLADASHELRTPLTSIGGYAEMFDRGARDRPEDLATSMRHIRAEADRMSRLVDDLLLLARLDRERPLEHEVVDLADVVAPAVEAARVLDPGRTFTFETQVPLTVVGDAGRLRQVADNLLVNAVRHTPPASPVVVRLTGQQGWVVLEVIDRGPGVSQEDQAHIFEPFHRADPSRARSTGGVGLGLAIVSAIAQAHGGTVGVRSGSATDGAEREETSGATFWVRLPVAGAPTGRDAPPDREESEPGMRHELGPTAPVVQASQR